VIYRAFFYIIQPGAGVLHNVALFVICLALSSLMPLLLSPLYSVGHGVSVVSVHEQSLLSASLHTGDVIEV